MRLQTMTRWLAQPQRGNKAANSRDCREAGRPGIRAARSVRRALHGWRLGLVVTAWLWPVAALAESSSPTFSLDASAIVDTLAVVSGGAGHGVRVLARADLVGNYDGSAGALPWVSAQVDLAAINGTSISALAGDAQGLSNIEFDRTVRVVNAWVQASSTHAAIKLGVIDTNLDFDEQNVGTMFVHSSHGIGPEFSGAGLDGPGGAPDTTLGAVVSVFDAAAEWKPRAGLFNGRPGDPAHPGRPGFAFGRDIGVLVIVEADWQGDLGRVSVGGCISPRSCRRSMAAVTGAGLRAGSSRSSAT